MPGSSTSLVSSLTGANSCLFNSQFFLLSLEESLKFVEVHHEFLKQVWLHDMTLRDSCFSHMDSNIPANPAYGVYISQLVRYVRICTSKLDFIRRLRRLSSRLLHQGFKSTLLHKSFTKFFKRHSAIIEKYGTTLREIRLAIQN